MYKVKCTVLSVHWKLYIVRYRVCEALPDTAYRGICGVSYFFRETIFRVKATFCVTTISVEPDFSWKSTPMKIIWIHIWGENHPLCKHFAYGEIMLTLNISLFDGHCVVQIIASLFVFTRPPSLGQKKHKGKSFPMV